MSTKKDNSSIQSPSVPVGVEWIMELADEYDAKGKHEQAHDLRALAQQPAADPLVEWGNSPLNFTATVGTFNDGTQPAAVDEAWLSKARSLYDRCSVYPETKPDGMIALLELRNHVYSILAPQPGGSDNGSV